MNRSTDARRIAHMVSMTVVIALACLIGAGSAPASLSAGSTAHAGGVYRVGWEKSFNFTDSFDPTGEYLSDGFGIYSNLMIRTLVGYDHVAGASGNRLVPDLATSVPKPTAGGTIYTFHLKPGIRFGPPVKREITSRDILYALERLAKPKDGGQYSFYYTVIKGFAAYGAGKTKSITGISTPNAGTIVFHLTRPTGDFLYRMSMPATGPIPAEVARCFEGQPGKYGRDLVSSGPYMIQGADKVDDSSCAKLQQMSGFDGQTTLTLVRNPDYDPKTDSAAARQNLPDEFQFTVDSSATDILDKVAAGQLDDEISTIPPQVLEQDYTTPSLRHSLQLNPNDLTNYVTMNLTQPPFDDIHVRRAMNWIMDKAGLLQAYGGPTAGTIATHIAPDTIFNNQLAEYDPYKTPGEHGSLADAKAAMIGSRYDTAHNGLCSAPQCKNVLLLADAHAVDANLVAVIEQSAAKIGITFTVRTVNGGYPFVGSPFRNIPIAEFPGWGKDYADPLTFFNPLFDGRTIIPSGNTNYSLVGISLPQCKTLHVTGNCATVPKVNAQLDRCAALTRQPRRSCYENLDRYLMTQVAPWIPYRWAYAQHVTSTNVTQWQFDQFSGTIAYAHVAVRT